MEETSSAPAPARGLGLTPGETAVVLLSFEGPDRYARKGELGASMDGLSTAFADAGFETTLIFVGDPDAPAEEDRATPSGGTRHLVRWSQRISRYYPDGPYEEEEARVHDYTEAVPAYIAGLDAVSRLSDAQGASRPGLLVLAHEWQTSGALLGLNALLRQRGQRRRALLVWTLRDSLNLGRVDLGALSRSVTVTTVSRHLKHELWKHGLDPITLPPGLAPESFAAPAPATPQKAEVLAAGRLLIFAPRVPMWWRVAVCDAIATLKRLGRRPLLVTADDIVVSAVASALTVAAYGEAGVPAPGAADVLIAARSLDQAATRELYAAATATLLLADSDATATALLQTMAEGAVVVTDGAMSDPLIAYQNGVALETRASAELVTVLLELDRDPEHLAAIRRIARSTAEGYDWSRTLSTYLVKLGFLFSA